jgi:hypothetical protein
MNNLAATCPDYHHGHRPLLAALGAGALRAVMWPLRVIEARRTLEQLAGLSDFTARPLDEDPTPHLADSRAARARAAYRRRLGD